MSRDEEAAANADLCLRFVRAAQVGDAAVVAASIVQDYVQVFPRPGIPGFPAAIEGRDQLVEFLSMLPAIYEPDSLSMDVEHVIAEGPMVAIQFRMTATTVSGEPYENHYVQILECHDARVVKSWEYCDTLYAARMIMPDAISDAS